MQGLSRGAEVGSCANPAGLAGKGEEPFALNPPITTLQDRGGEQKEDEGIPLR